MSNTVTDLRKAVAGFLNRDESYFVSNGFDNLLQACNNARLYIERCENFEFNRVQVQLDSVSITNGGSLTNAKLLGTATSVSIKQLQRAFLALDGGVGTFPVEIIGRDTHMKRQQRRYAMLTNTNPSGQPIPSVLMPFAVVQMAQTVYPIPNRADAFGSSSTVTLYFDAWKWMAPYTTGGTENDFLLDYAFDYMLYKTAAELRVFMKDSQEVQVAGTMAKDAYASVKNWNATIIGQSTDDVTLQ